MRLKKIHSVLSKLSKMTFEKCFCIQKKTVLKKTSVPKRKRKKSTSRKMTSEKDFCTFWKTLMYLKEKKFELK